MSTIAARFRRAPAGWAALFALVACAPASAQSAPPIQGVTTTLPGLTLADTINQLVTPAGATHVGAALGLAAKLEIATAPVGASSDGFVIKLDPTTGLQVRTATTFGPFFAERALTSGEGSVSVGVNVTSSTFDRLGTLAVSGLQLSSVAATSPSNGRSGTANLTITSNTVVVSGRMGVTDRLDVGVAVPVVTVKVNGTSSLQDGNGNPILFATGSGVATGLGDIAGIVKYRFFAFGSGQPDPGGLAVMATMRLPTGDPDNLRGLGITRTLLSLIASSGQGRIRPHANVGYEYWSKGVSVTSDDAQSATVTARNQAEFAAGLEFEAAPKCTLLIDLLGGEIFGGGKMGVQTAASPAPGVTSSESLVALPQAVQRLELAPGLKVNLKGKLLLAVNALVDLRDTGLHARVTPAAGIDLSF
jgi:hypothetical protein